mgnify:CR=1 FL=1
MFVALTLLALLGQSFAGISFFSQNTITFYEDGRQSDIINDQGGFSDFINCDDSSSNNASIGDFETLKRCQTLEEIQHACLIPCEVPAVMECRSDQIQFVTVQFVYSQCLNLTNDMTNPSKGLYALNAHMRQQYGGGCDRTDRIGEDCRDTLGEDCDAPDSECRYYCSETQAERDQYCADRLVAVSKKRALAVEALKALIDEKMKTKRTIFKTKSLVRKALSESLFKRAMENEENPELIFMSALLKDDKINWDN